jgi:GNAT superfamily N-acetyltransferase
MAVGQVAHRRPFVRLPVTGRRQIGGVRSGSRGEYGDLIPVRPAAGRADRCLRGHWLDLYGRLASYSQRYRLHATFCETCHAQEACDPGARRLAEWAHLDVAIQHAPDAAPGAGLVLVARPPATEAPTGRIELRLDGTTVGAASIALCIPCRTAMLDYVHVDAAHRGLGYGRTLVAAARARAASYRWTAPLPAGPAAQGFRARIAMPRAAPLCVHR